MLSRGPVRGGSELGVPGQAALTQSCPPNVPVPREKRAQVLLQRKSEGRPDPWGPRDSLGLASLASLSEWNCPNAMPATPVHPA